MGIKNAYQKAEVGDTIYWRGYVTIESGVIEKKEKGALFIQKGITIFSSDIIKIVKEDGTVIDDETNEEKIISLIKKNFGYNVKTWNTDYFPGEIKPKVFYQIDFPDESLLMPLFTNADLKPVAKDIVELKSAEILTWAEEVFTFPENYDSQDKVIASGIIRAYNSIKTDPTEDSK